MSLRIYFIRHGATDWTASGQYTGGTDVPLSAQGEAAARKLAPRSRDISFARVPMSPLQRARRTCELASASIALSRKRASEGLFPAVNLLQSNSRMATPGSIGARHHLLAQEIRKTLAQYEDLKDIVAMLGMEQLPPDFAIEQCNGIAGKDVGPKDGLDGCERLLNDEFKDHPESALHMTEAVDEAKPGKPGFKGSPPPKTDPKPKPDTDLGIPTENNHAATAHVS